MSRFLYWTIVVGDEPTAFRAREAAELRPTLVQLQRTRPEAALKWFQRGRLWASPEEARAALRAERDTARKRPPTWRPGGTHEDPRQKYADAKKAKWQRFKQAIRARAEGRRERGTAEPGRPDVRDQREDRPRRDRPPRQERPWQERPASGDRSAREKRPPGEDRRPRADRPPRSERPPYPDRAPRDDRGPRTEPPARDQRPPRDDRRPRDESRSRGGGQWRPGEGSARRPAWRDRPAGDRPRNERPASGRPPRPTWREGSDPERGREQGRDRPGGSRPSRPPGHRPPPDRQGDRTRGPRKPRKD